MGLYKIALGPCDNQSCGLNYVIWGRNKIYFSIITQVVCDECVRAMNEIWVRCNSMEWEIYISKIKNEKKNIYIYM